MPCELIRVVHPVRRGIKPARAGRADLPGGPEPFRAAERSAPARGRLEDPRGFERFLRAGEQKLLGLGKGLPGKAIALDFRGRDILVWADREYLQEVRDNLVSDALKFMAPGPSVRTVTMSLHGRVEQESQLGRGSCFRVCVPLAPEG